MFRITPDPLMLMEVEQSLQLLHHHRRSPSNVISFTHMHTLSLLPGFDLTPHLLYLTLQFFVFSLTFINFIVFMFISSAVAIYSPYIKCQQFTFILS